MIVRSLVGLLASACIVVASSRARNPLTSLAIVESPAINTTSHRVNAYSSFDLSFDLYRHHRRLKLSLEPNLDVIADGASVSFLAADGSVERTTTIRRLDHRVYKGSARLERGDGSWANVGWARISILQDGSSPLFEGAFTIHGEHHHIQSRSSYIRTKHLLDPDIDPSGEEYMVLWKSSDVSKDTAEHTDLKRAAARELSCLSDRLSYNQKSFPAAYTPMLKREESYWGSMSMSSLFGKRQIDTQPSSGNTGGVNLAETIGQTAGCPTTRKVALVGVATDCGYTAQFDSHDAVQANIISLMNSASNVWEQTFNISLGLQNVTISPNSCPTTPQTSTEWNQACSSNITIGDRLNLFSAWRGTLQDNNSHWTLLTACPDGSAVGLAWLGQACVNTAFTTNATGSSETVSGANVVALTSTDWEIIAHETGHTYGAVHDCIPETCSDGTETAQQCCPLSSTTCDAGEQYIMNPYTLSGIRQFSACTVGEICSAIGRNSINTACLSDNKGVVSVSGSTCGNGIVEQGEECDCGTAAECVSDPCCNPSTCKYTTGSVCDDVNDACCRNCQLATNGTVCRASTGQCDPAEYCSGTSAACPADQTAPDGTGCTDSSVVNAGTLQCASGQCTSRDLQCQTVMGSYNNAGNNTYACDSQNCVISCASPAFGQGVCYGLQQNFLDGTPCDGNGHCSNGQCLGATFGGEIKSWIDDHRSLVIGVAAGIGALILFAFISCLWRCFRRRRYNSRVVAQRKLSPNASWYGPAAMHGGPPPPPPPHHNPEFIGAYAPPPMPPPAYSGTTQAFPQRESDIPSPAPDRHSQYQGLYGGGIIGSRDSTWNAPQPVSPVSPVGEPQRPMWGRQPSMRYA